MQDKLNVFIAMAPVAMLDHTNNKFFLNFAKDTDSVQWWLDKFGIHELFGTKWQAAQKSFCWFKASFCEGAADALETRKLRFDTSKVPEHEQTLQNSASVKLIVHLGQIISRKKF